MGGFFCACGVIQPGGKGNQGIDFSGIGMNLPYFKYFSNQS